MIAKAPSHSKSATARLPSSMKSPAISRSISTSFLMSGLVRSPLGTHAARQGRSAETGDEKADGQVEERPIMSGPGNAHPFAAPEDAKCGEHDADAEFQSILRHP